MTENPVTRRAPAGLAALDAAALRRWMFRAREDLGRHRGAIDALNVYPVPDGDTGTNLHLTLDVGLRGFVETLVARARERDEVLGIVDGTAVMARATLYAARGNSGVILSQLVAGLAGAVAAVPDVEETGIDGALMASILEEADVRARRAVAQPVEGTILTVMRGAAQAARVAVEAGADLAGVVAAACDAARVVLAATPTQLAALARAGVVDAGGAGLVVVLDALRAQVEGVGGAERRGDGDGIGHADRSSWGAGPGSPHAPVHTSPAYEVMFLLDGVDDDGALRLRTRLSEIGDSVLVAGDVGLRTVHVHTDEPGLAVEAGVDVGRPYGVRIATLTEIDAACHAVGVGAVTASPDGGEAGDGSPRTGLGTVSPDDGVVAADALTAPSVTGTAEPTVAMEGTDASAATEATDATDAGEAPARRALGVVACVQAPRLVPLFEDHGAVVLADAPGRRVSPSQLVEAARSTTAGRVAVLPDDGDAVLAASAAVTIAQEEGIDLVIVPAAHLLQGLAALAVADLDDASSIEGMASAATAVRCGFVATATSGATTDAGPCTPGDALGVTDGRVTHVGGRTRTVAAALLRDLLGDGAEIVTLVDGAQGAGIGAAVAADLAEELDGVEVTLLDGGQAVYDVLIGVE